MKRLSLITEVFLSIVAVSLAAVLATGLIARGALEGAFGRYLAGGSTNAIGPGGRAGRQMLLGRAEQTFLTTVDQGIVVSVLIAIVLAALGAWLLARYLVRPLRSLTAASRALAAGDLASRVDEEGPAEVAGLAAAFNDMAGSLAESEELRQRMVNDVAHELRNPIAALRAQIEGIADGVLSADERRIASLVEDVGTLSRLVDDLQELSVAEAGRLRYELARFDLRTLIALEVKRAESIAAPGVAVRAVVGSDPVYVVADEFRIAQVVRNLLSNAVRYTPAGSVTVEVTLSDSGSVRVSVRDTGEGIPESDLPRIWERFYRVDAARAYDTGGTGLGLAISRQIIADHGGSVFARSARGQGSEIGFELPLAETTIGEDAPI
ncbi:MAG: HAMP domain-containing sensor histidine kinase [Coriobacteriia bacterium]|nr:HAMP domain-containing sensor histidine kinase [Coriobacteriia bacterium]